MDDDDNDDSDDEEFDARTFHGNAVEPNIDVDHYDDVFDARNPYGNVVEPGLMLMIMMMVRCSVV